MRAIRADTDLRVTSPERVFRGASHFTPHAPALAAGRRSMTPAQPAVRRVGSVRAGFGEGALWSDRDNALWWVDMSQHAVYRTAPDGSTRQFDLDASPGGLAVRSSGGLVVAAERALVSIDLASSALATLPYQFDLPKDHVFNDATVDGAGRLLVGSIQRGGGGDGRGLLLRIARDRTPEVLLDGFWRVNGLAMSPDGCRLYVSDSHPNIRRVWHLTYDSDTGAVGPRELFTDFAGIEGRPDGAAVDIEGCYWSAAHDAGLIHRFTPDGLLERSVAVPSPGPTKPAFGGAELRTVFVSTAGTLAHMTDDGVRGALFAFEAPVRGCQVPPTNL